MGHHRKLSRANRTRFIRKAALADVCIDEKGSAHSKVYNLYTDIDDAYCKSKQMWGCALSIVAIRYWRCLAVPVHHDPRYKLMS